MNDKQFEAAIARLGEIARCAGFVDVRPGDIGDKDAFHRAARSLLREVADRSGFGKVEIRSNPGGPAVWGETILQAESVEVWMTVEKFPGQVMYRQLLTEPVPGQKRPRELTGQNHWMRIDEIGGLPDRLRKMAAAPFVRF